MPEVLTVQVRTPEGLPVSRASVVCLGPGSNAVLKGPRIEGGQDLETDAGGRLRLRLEKGKTFLVAADETGIGVAASFDLIEHPTLVIQPWGRVEGIRLNRDRPLAGQKLFYFPRFFECVGSHEFEQRFAVFNEVATDSQGRFAVEYVPPMIVQFYEVHQHPRIAERLLPLVSVTPGGTAHVKLQTQGRTIVGQLALGPGLPDNIDFQSCFGALILDTGVPSPKQPWPTAEIDTIEKRTDFWRQWYGTSPGQQFLKAKAASRILEFHKDGSFTAECVQAGTYRLEGNLSQDCQRLADFNRQEIKIPEPSPEVQDTAFDLGKVSLVATRNLKVGDAAPGFSVPSLNDGVTSLSDFRGKYVLLDFWATWCGPCVREIPKLVETYNAFSHDPRFEMMWLSLDADRQTLASFVRTHGIPWTQGFLGEWSKDTVSRDYGVWAIPRIFLIGSDGKIVARDLRGSRIKEAVASALEADARNQNSL